MLKQFLSQDRRPNLGRNMLSYQKYEDKMTSNLNKTILENVRPYWRDHASLKGKSSQQ